MPHILLNAKIFQPFYENVCLISSFDINHHPYADDTNAKESLEKLQHCLMGVSAWMMGLKLKPNPNMISSYWDRTSTRKILNHLPCLILGQDQTCRACFYHNRDLRRIRKSLPLRSCQANRSGTRQ